MYDCIEKVDWNVALKLAQHMRLIPSVSVDFRAGKQ